MKRRNFQIKSFKASETQKKIVYNNLKPSKIQSRIPRAIDHKKFKKMMRNKDQSIISSIKLSSMESKPRSFSSNHISKKQLFNASNPRYQQYSRRASSNQKKKNTFSLGTKDKKEINLMFERLKEKGRIQGYPFVTAANKRKMINPLIDSNPNMGDINREVLSLNSLKIDHITQLDKLNRLDYPNRGVIYQDTRLAPQNLYNNKEDKVISQKIIKKELEDSVIIEESSEEQSKIVESKVGIFKEKTNNKLKVQDPSIINSLVAFGSKSSQYSKDGKVDRSKKDLKYKKKSVKQSKAYYLLKRLLFLRNKQLFSRVRTQSLNTEPDMVKLPRMFTVQKMISDFDKIQTEKSCKLCVIIRALIWKDMMAALIFKLIEVVTFVAFLLVLFEYSEYLFVVERVTLYDTAIYLGTVLTLIAGSRLSREHSESLGFQASMKVAQCFRGIYYEHILTANYSFLKNIEPSQVVKILSGKMKDLREVFNLFSKSIEFPVISLVSIIIIFTKYGWMHTVYYMVANLIEYSVVKALQILKNRYLKKYESCNRKKRCLIEDVMRDLRTVKLNDWETFYSERLNTNHKKQHIQEQYVLYLLGLQQVIKYASPLVLTLVVSLNILWNRQSLEVIDLLEFYLLISFSTQLQMSLTRFDDALVGYFSFQRSLSCVKIFFKLVRQRYKGVDYSAWMEKGHIKIQGCTACVEDDMKTHIILQHIMDPTSDKITEITDTKDPRYFVGHDNKKNLFFNSSINTSNHSPSKTTGIPKNYHFQFSSQKQARLEISKDILPERHKSSFCSNSDDGENDGHQILGKSQPSTSKKDLIRKMHERSKSKKNITRKKTYQKVVKNPTESSNFCSIKEDLGGQNQLGSQKGSLFKKKNVSKKSILNQERLNNIGSRKTSSKFVSGGSNGLISSFQVEYNSLKHVQMPTISLLNKKSLVGVSQVVNKGANSRLTQEGDFIKHIDVSLEIHPGRVVCLMGKKDDSGASGVLQTIMNETFVVQGICDVSGSFAYLSLGGDPYFLTDKTLVKNIILDELFDQQKYVQVLQTCKIKLKDFERGDLTLLKERGSSLSKEYQLKVTLARFLYQERDIYLFDNFFDEIDSSQDEQLFDRVVTQYLQSKTVVFCSNREQYIDHSEHVYIFKAGMIVDQGSPRNLKESSKVNFHSLMIPKTESYSVFSFDNEESSNQESKYCNSHSRNLLLQKMSNTLILDGVQKVKDTPLFRFIQKENQTNEKGLSFFDQTPKDEMVNQLFNLLADCCNSNIYKEYAVHVGHETSPYQHYESITSLFARYFLFSRLNLALAVTTIFLVFGLLSYPLPLLFLGTWVSGAANKFLSISQHLIIYILLVIVCSLLHFFCQFHLISRLQIISESIKSIFVSKLFDTSINWFEERSVYPKTSSLSAFLRETVLDQSQSSLPLKTSIIDLSLSLISGAAGLFILNVLFGGVLLVPTVVIMAALSSQLSTYHSNYVKYAILRANNLNKLESIFFTLAEDVINLQRAGSLGQSKLVFYEASNALQNSQLHTSNFAKRWLGIRLVLLYILIVFLVLVCSLLLKLYLPQFFIYPDIRIVLSIQTTLVFMLSVDSIISSYFSLVDCLISLNQVLSKLDQSPEKSKDAIKKIDISNILENDINLIKSKLKDKILNKDLIDRRRNKEVGHKKRITFIKAINIQLEKPGKENGKLHNVSFEIPWGGRIAIIGSDGSGQRSIMEIILGLRPRGAGELSILGHPYEKIDPLELRSLSFCLDKEPRLLGKTIRECIDPFGKRKDRELLQILSFLGLEDEIKVNAYSVRDLQGWKHIQNDPSKKMQLVANLSSFAVSLRSQERRILENASGMRVGSKWSQKMKLVTLYRQVFSSMILHNRGEVVTEEQICSNINQMITRQSNKQGFKCLSGNNLECRSLSPKSSIGAARSYQEEKQMSQYYLSLANLQRAMSSANEFDYSVSSKQGKDTHKENTLKTFLDLGVHDLGANIPADMRKIVLIAKAIISHPKMLFVDEQSLEYGSHLSWHKVFKSLSNICLDSTIFSFLKNTDKLLGFDYVLIVDKGKVIESGEMSDLLKDPQSLLVKRIKKKNPALYQKLVKHFGIHDLQQIISSLSIENQDKIKSSQQKLRGNQCICIEQDLFSEENSQRNRLGNGNNSMIIEIEEDREQDEDDIAQSCDINISERSLERNQALHHITGDIDSKGVEKPDDRSFSRGTVKLGALKPQCDLQMLDQKEEISSEEIWDFSSEKSKPE